MHQKILLATWNSINTNYMKDNTYYIQYLKCINSIDNNSNIMQDFFMIR